jgi:Raf kinase inhibitor-like YbhB/YbcL family protein
MRIASSAFHHGAHIPTKYTGDGEDVSPPLAWDQAPTDTKQFALICDDPDAPTAQPWVHWVLYLIPAKISALPEGMTSSPQLGLEGQNSWRDGKTIGYRGPAPPPGHGVHHYHFRLYALGTELSLPTAADKQTVLNAMDGHILAACELIGTYERR